VVGVSTSGGNIIATHQIGLLAGLLAVTHLGLHQFG
jgi:hypothetical protein